MNRKNILALVTMPAITALFVTGCCSTSTPVATHQGAPAVEQKTEVTAVTGGAETASQADIQLHKEELVVGKRVISNGGLLVRTVVQTENVSQPVQLQREEYVIERVPASEAAITSKDIVFQGKEIYIPLTREEPVASKRALLTEKVQIAKRVETDHKTITMPVRSEDVEISKVTGKAAGNIWQETAPVAATPTEANSLNLLREEMIVGKTVVDNGGVTLRKVVHTKDATEPIDLTREEFTINRSPVTDQQVANADFNPKELRLNLTREDAVAGTRIQPTEVVRVRKQIHTDSQTVTGTIRKEGLEIQKLAAESAMGGTGVSSQSGTSTISESGYFQGEKDVTITGKAMCGKCMLHQTADCQNVIEVKEGANTQVYYLVDNDLSKSLSKSACKAGKEVTAIGSVHKSGERLEFLAHKITLTP